MNNQIQLVLKSSTTELSLNDRELGIYLTPELDGLTGLPEIRTTSGVNAGYDGGWTSAQNYDARSITIRGVIANEDVATVEQLRRQLTTLAGQGKNEELTLDLVTQAGKAYTIQVRTIALEMSLQKVLTQQEFMLQLRADDPLIYDASETTHEALLQVAQATGGFTIDFELPLAITGSSEETIVNNEGLEQVPTVTRMYGELHNPKIINQTTNQFMQIEADLGFAEGDWTTPSEPVEGKNLTINDALENAPLSGFKLNGNTTQNGTPTPDAPVAVQTVTGENVVKICGKNLLKLPSAGTNAGVTYSINSDGTFNVHGTNNSGYEILFSLYLDSSEFQSVDYTLGASKALPYGLGCRCEIYRGGTWKRSFVSVNYTRQTQTGTPDFTDANRVRVAITIANGATVNIDNVGIQLEKGSSASSFVPYQEQSYPVSLGSLEFCAIGDYVDKPAKIGDKWYKHKAIGKIIQNGSVQVNYYDAPSVAIANDSLTAYFSVYGYGDYVNGINYKCNMFGTPYSRASDIWGSASSPASAYRYEGMVKDGSALRVRILKSRLTGWSDSLSAADKANLMKTWLNNNTPVVYGALTTPVNEEITNEALIEQLDAILQEARMYSPQTNITTLYAEGNEQGTLSISYFTDKNPDTRDELVIDSRLRTITLNGLDVYHLQAPGSEFLMLAPGENRLSLQSDITGDNGYAQVSYKQGYLSI